MKPGHNKTNMLAPVVGGVFALTAWAAWGQTVPPDAGRLMGTVKEPVQAPRNSPSIDVQQEVRPALSPAAGFKIAVKGFRFSGNNSVPEAE